MISSILATIANHNINDKILQEYLNSNLSNPKNTEKVISHDMEAGLSSIIKSNEEYSILKQLVSNLTKETKNILYRIALIDIKDIQNKDIQKELSELYNLNLQVSKIAEGRVKNNHSEKFKDEHKKVLYYSMYFDNFLYSLTDEVLLDTIDEITISENIYEAGKEIYNFRNQVV